MTTRVAAFAQTNRFIAGLLFPSESPVSSLGLNCHRNSWAYFKFNEIYCLIAELTCIALNRKKKYQGNKSLINPNALISQSAKGSPMDMMWFACVNAWIPWAWSNFWSCHLAQQMAYIISWGLGQMDPGHHLTLIKNQLNAAM